MPRKSSNRIKRKITKIVVSSDWSKQKKKSYRSLVRKRTGAARKRKAYYEKIAVLRKRINEWDDEIWKMEDMPVETQDWDEGQCDHHTNLLSHSCSTEIMEEDKFAMDPKDREALLMLMRMQAKQKEDIGVVQIAHTPMGNVVIKLEKDLHCHEQPWAPNQHKEVTEEPMDLPSHYDINEKIN